MNLPINLSGWLTRLESLHSKPIDLGLERVEQVRQRLKLKIDFPLIVVGGTNGKGSTCAMLEAMLHAGGYQVGCYTSPHFLEYNERVRIGKVPASDAALCAAFERIEQARENIPLTYFEFGTLAAMACFVDSKVDVAVLEVGLGGRLDAVNVFDADCAIVTSVDLDHMDYLGDTRDIIAVEKAGIFRSGRVAVYADRDMPQTIATTAQQRGAELWQLGINYDYSAKQQQWDFKGRTHVRYALPYPALRGSYQLNNASAALAALDALQDQLPLSMEAVRAGLSQVTLPGRFQVLPGFPQVILDVAHNPHAARALADNLAAMPPARTGAVFAMLNDKDIRGVVHSLKGKIDDWWVAGIDAPRGATAEKIRQIVLQTGVPAQSVQAFPTVTEALNCARNEVGENGRIIAFGSFYTVAEAMRASARAHDGKKNRG